MDGCCGQYGLRDHASHLKLLVSSLLFCQEDTPITEFFPPLVEEEYVFIMSDKSNRNGSDLEVEDLICPSYRNTH